MEDTLNVLNSRGCYCTSQSLYTNKATITPKSLVHYYHEEKTGVRGGSWQWSQGVQASELLKQEFIHSQSTLEI